MTKPWPKVRWERLKLLLWAVRNPRRLSGWRYARATGMHLSGYERAGSIDRDELLRQIQALKAEAAALLNKNDPGLGGRRA